MKRLLGPLVAVFAFAGAPHADAHAQSGEWRPTQADIRNAEKGLRLPPGADGPIQSYDRYYAGVIENGRRVIVDELVGLAKMPRPDGETKMVPLREMPGYADFGCSVMTFTFDVQSDVAPIPTCNAALPVPPVK